MNHWWVNHGGNYKSEIRDGYMIAPRQGRIFWENMSKVKKGDYIFSYAGKCIRDIGIAESDPKLVRARENSNSSVEWYVKVSWTTLNIPFRTLTVWEKTKHLFKKCQNAPLTESGKGCQGYLYDITKEIFDLYCNIINENCKTDISKFIYNINNVVTKDNFKINNEIDFIEDKENLEFVDYDDNNDEVIIEETNFTYERDLQDALIRQIGKLFPDYNIFENGVEYSIEGKRIDVLLENKSKNELLIIELKAGLAKKEVLSQISEYMGKLKRKFSDKNINGLIIAGEIDDSLKDACSPFPNIKTLKYGIEITLSE